MTNPRNIKYKVEQVMASLDNADRAKSNPFIFTRVMASLKKEKKNSWTGFINKPVISLVAIMVVVIMNSLVFFQSSETSQQSPVQEEDQIFASEYNYPQTLI